MSDTNNAAPQRQSNSQTINREELIPIHFHDCHHTIERGESTWREEFNDFHFNYILFDWFCYYNRAPSEMINGYALGQESTELDPASFTMTHDIVNTKTWVINDLLGGRSSKKDPSKRLQKLIKFGRLWGYDIIMD